MWQPPKTDWQKTDCPTWRDYERIRQNFDQLAIAMSAVTENVFLTHMESVTNAVINNPDFSGYTVGAVTDDLRYAAPVFESDFNAFEENLKRLARADKRQVLIKAWYGNGDIPKESDFNRWEETCLLIYNNIQRTAKIMKRLPKTLNGGIF